MKKNNKKAYTIIIVIILIGFMVFLTTGVFKLVLNERKDNEAIGDYFKAYIGAEAAQELALLKVKEKGFGYDEPMYESDILGNSNKSPKISYTNNGKTKSYSGILEPLTYNIMPLFYIKEDSSEVKIDNYDLEILGGNANNLSWNIVGKEFGISGIGSDTTNGAKKYLELGNMRYADVRVSDFLTSSDTNYLILFNNSNNNIKYKISSGKEFTKPKISIISSAGIGTFKQNIKTDINYSDIVNRAKYTIYSGD